MGPVEKSRGGVGWSTSSSILGRVPLLVRSELYELRVPRLFGTYGLACDPSPLPWEEPSEGLPEDFLPPFNVLDAVLDLPDHLRGDLNGEECAGILGRFRVARSAFLALEAAHGRPWVRETMAELKASAARIFGPDRHLGESRWASLLGAERGLKAFLVSRAQRASHTHQLQELAAIAAEHGLVGIPRAWIAPVQCQKGVVDDEPPVSLEEAVRARECALKIVRHAVVGIPRAVE